MSASPSMVQSLGLLSHQVAPGHHSGISEHAEDSSYPMGLARYATACSYTEQARTVLLLDFKSFLHLILSPSRLLCTCLLYRFSCVLRFATLWTVACQAPLSMVLSRQEYWRGLPCPSPGNLPNPGIKLVSFMSPELAELFTGETQLGITRH